MWWFLTLFVVYLVSTTTGYNYDERWVSYNLNTNKDAQSPLEYTGEWTDTPRTPSPENWRFPFYTLFLDRFVNGDPTNDNINGTLFEHDLTSTQMRNGGDVQGLINTLDYLHGMGIKGLYIAGSPFLNQPWTADSYSPIDLTILDWHFGTIELWRTAVQEIHKRGMYVVLDNTFATMGDLLGFEGYLNETAPFTLDEHKVQWKSDKRYYDFDVSPDYNETCKYPRFWLETGYPVGEDVTSQMKGCYAGEFDQYGDTEAFGVYPDWRRQLTKFASVQDRLRDWHEPTRKKIEVFYCNLIAQLDVDGFRYDKAMQATADAMGSMNKAMRQCARKYGKENFFLPGEITGGNVAGSIFIGRGRQPDQKPETLLLGATLNSSSDDKYFIRDLGEEGLDSGAFHYTTYRSMTRFLGMSGNLAAGYDSPLNWVDQWNDFILTNDLINANTGKWDPRHMYGVTNQDVFRWPSIHQGIQRQLLGHYITTLLMPGVPLLLWGEEQSMYLLDNTATNYIFGRQPMSAATAWMQHGCYSFAKPSSQYFEMPMTKARDGCRDETQMYDQRNPTHPVRNILRHMYKMRQNYPILNDGMFLQQLSNRTNETILLGSTDVPTEFGLWSVLRTGFPGVQNMTTDTSIWLVYSNRNDTTDYTFNCNDNSTYLNTTALLAPFDSGTTVKNLFHPFDELTLASSVKKLGIAGSDKPSGCISSLRMEPYGFKAYVPKADWKGPQPMLTKFSPGYDVRLESTVSAGQSEDVEIEFQWSESMDCDSITKAISFESTTISGKTPSIKSGSVQCSAVPAQNNTELIGFIPSQFSYKATLSGVENGVHALIVEPLSSTGGASTEAREKVLFRIGQKSNPVIFPLRSNYSTSLLTKSGGKLTLNHEAAGASMFRYSTNWGSSFSDWQQLTGPTSDIKEQPWSGTKLQAWKGTHVRVEYYSPLVGQSDIVQHADVDRDGYTSRYPHLFWNGEYNLHGYDAGLENKFDLINDSQWAHHFAAEWVPRGVSAKINVWGMNPDQQPDQSFIFGDIDGDSVLDRLPPSSLSDVSINITSSPPKPYLAWKILVNDGTMRFTLVPSGNMWLQLALYIILWTVPVIAATTFVWLYMKSFYGIKFNEVGLGQKASMLQMTVLNLFGKGYKLSEDEEAHGEKSHFLTVLKDRTKKSFKQTKNEIVPLDPNKRRMVLIATMEYNIEDWKVKVKIGGLGVMAQLMGQNLQHQDLIWVVPCVGDIDYPFSEDTASESIQVVILDKIYDIEVHVHKVENITYVLLDAPVFRQQTKAEPYPARMDDIESAIYYSSWNQCIATISTRFAIDLYHINDYHGTLAPLYLLPKTIPCCLSLHNAEFQGLWPMRTKEEAAEVCSVFNLPPEIVQKYVQFGEVFNLLHAGASILREHQNGFGAVGVSKKYGKRAFARYAIFWGLNKVQALPNPDPSDTAAWDKKLPKESDIVVDPEYEASRGDLRRQAQEWAGLTVDPTAELFVFVGRWSMQKGIDLIADVFPAVLEANPKAQLITIGPVIDLYGKFAAAKLDKMMQVYPGRVFSKPTFTALPPFIFSGAEFALIPSRDEPFGLVAVEFGRKGALGVGARVGGLGQMPGWWFTVESVTPAHLTHQFKMAIQEALASSTETRALMRARSAKQRFPVAQWVEDLEILQSTSIRLHDKIAASRKDQSLGHFGLSAPRGYLSGPASPGFLTPRITEGSRLSMQAINDKLNAMIAKEDQKRLSKRKFTSLPRGKQQISLGVAKGPGHHSRGESEMTMPTGASTLTSPSLIDLHSTPAAPRPGFFIGRATSGYDTDDGDETDNEDPFDEPVTDQPMIGQVGVRPAPAQSNRYSTATALTGPPSPPREIKFTRFSENLSGASTPAAYTSMPPTPGYAPTSGLESPPLAAPQPSFARGNRISSASTLSLSSVVGSKTDFNLQKVDPFFTDSNGEFYKDFNERLEGLNAANSEKTSIEEYLVKSEKKWFNSFRDAKLGRSHKNDSHLSLDPSRTMGNSRANSDYAASTRRASISSSHETDEAYKDEFLLGRDYKPPTGLKKIMQLRFCDWPLYSILLALGQIMAANSYTITLLTGEIGQTADKLYVVASIYLVTSGMWWYMYRRLASRYCLAIPFGLYGVAFMFIGLAHFGPSVYSRGWIQNIGTAFYAIASSSGSIYFGVNFGDEGGTPMKVWMVRATFIQGIQQIYIVALWGWGSYLSRRAGEGITSNAVSGSWIISAICFPIAVVLWAIGFIVFKGLPKYYYQQPGAIPSFYTSITRRKLVLWFLLTVVVSNFFLASPYGRTWQYLFSSRVLPVWMIALLVIFFFVFVWAAVLALFGYISMSHSWALCLFGFGLGPVRFFQVLWATSGIGLYLPWVGGPIASALAGRALWLWLGTLDTIQGLAIGVALMQTLTRSHLTFTLICGQVLGSLSTIIARACAPNALGPGPISPDISQGISALNTAWFWIALILNIGLYLGFVVFFRKEQLLKP